MTTLSKFGFLRHIRAQSNEFLLHYKRGQLVRKGHGLAYWFNPLSAAIAKVPTEDCETTFLLKERTADFQEAGVQCVVQYRFVDPQRAAQRVNFSISLDSGSWIDKPLEKLDDFWAMKARPAAREYLAGVTIIEAARTGADRIRRAINDLLAADNAVREMGLNVVGVQVVALTTTPELAKAIEAPTRESLQQKADEAVFQRRALAVEKERAIKENELATQIEIARRQEDLIARTAANAMLEVKTQNERQQAKAEADASLAALAAESYARDVRMKSAADADARRAIGEADAASESARINAWRGVEPAVAIGFAVRAGLDKVESIHHLNITPDMLGEGLTSLLRNRAGK
ncbi:MAG: SPFH domain-containing protein [Phycisphaerales bacterium]|nr:SPFH domain-containing protein [Phycisphaerales bacterium]